VAGRRIFVREQPGSGVPVVLLHGYPSSSYDWRRLLERLRGRRVLCFDFLGFGLSDKPRDVVYSLFDQADIVTRLVGDDKRPVVVVAHDMGTSVATELLARDLDGTLKFDLAGVLLFNGGMIVERASLTWAQQVLRSPFGAVLARLSSGPAFINQFSRLFSPSHPLSPEEGADQWALWRRAGGARIAHRLIHYIDERIEFAPRWHGALRDWPGELRLAWGLLDPVATVNVLAGIRELRPSVAVAELPSLGHYPQIEEPTVIADLVAALTPRRER
jgi:pimeloyl-ACP methyl ester carboxylesterase